MGIRLFNNLSLLEKALDASWLRNEVISNNLANVDTPRYKRQYVEFESFLSEALEQRKIKGYLTHEKHIPIGRQSPADVSIKVRQDNSQNTMRTDGNNVDIDLEMSLLAKNNIYYNALIQQVSRRLSSLKNVIQDGGR